MTELKGKGVYGGVAFGKIYFYNKKDEKVVRKHIDDPEKEIKRFQNAKNKAIEQLGNLYEKALVEVGETNAMIFQIHQMMLEDLDYLDSIENLIRNEKLNSEYAVAITSDNFAQMFSQMDDSYMKERAADVKDISERVINILIGKKSGGISSDCPVIIAADDLAPSETVQMDKSKVLAFVTRKGSVNSHTAILARNMNIPAIVGIGDILSENFDNQDAIVDGTSGTIYINPDEDTVLKMEKRLEEENRQKMYLASLKGKENITLDGKKINIYANIGDKDDVGQVILNDAGGIGLFRSEFLYLGRDDYPSEDEQFIAYKSVLEKMPKKKVVIRTLDIGADKQVDYFNMPLEDNPAMGVRAIRICFERPKLFKTQLRALYRASVYGTLCIMFPMIISVEEVLKIKDIIKNVKKELDAENIGYSNNIELGIMIETPASAVISDILAKEVDFFSVGTNDLIQYTLACDRQNRNLDGYYDVHHKAVLRLIKFAADNAHKNGKWIGICGELAGDLNLTETFLAMGIDELSVSPGNILKLRQKVRETDVSKIKCELI